MTIENIYNTLYESMSIELKRLGTLVENNRNSIYNLLVINKDFNYHKKNKDLTNSLKEVFKSDNLFLSIEAQCISLYFNFEKTEFHIDLNNSQSFFLLKNKADGNIYSTTLTKDRIYLQEYYGFGAEDNIRFNIKEYPTIIDNHSRGTAAYIENLNEIFELINSQNYSDAEIKDLLSLKSDYSEKSKESYFINHQLIINNLLKNEYKNKIKLKS